ncbi:MAG: hypothetical protein BPH100C_221 [Phage 5P_2]|nr:MAG: hypothetical protein BPH100C_221 [Phage 5P_2]
MRLHNRMVRATFWNDPDLLQQPRELRWFYQGLWHLADDSACLEDSPIAFKVNLFPGPLDNDITPELLAGYRDILISLRKLVPYTVNGKRCLYLVNFHRHQTIPTPSPPGKDSVPLPPWVRWQPGPTRGKSRYIVDEQALLAAMKALHSQTTDKLAGAETADILAPPLPEVTPPNKAPAKETDPGIKEPNNQQLIAELVDNHYRLIEGVKPAKGDYAFIGALYNEYGYEQVVTALNQLAMAMAVEPKDKPLVYLKGILKRQSQEGAINHDARAAPPGPTGTNRQYRRQSTGGNGGKKEIEGGQGKRRDYSSGILGQRALRDIPAAAEEDGGYGNH